MSRVSPWLLAVATAFACASPATAGHTPGHPPSDASAYDQYVEQIPSSTGSKAPGPGGGKKRPLPASVAAELRSQGADGAVLESIATDPALGAPERTLRPTPQVRKDLLNEVDDDPGVPGAASAALSVAADGSTGRLVGLVVALLGITAVLVALTLTRRRRAGPG